MAPISLTDPTSPPSLRRTDRISTSALHKKGPTNGTQASWDPYEVLDIYPNDPDFTCIGIAVYSNARCQWRFLDVSIRRAACARLDSIASKHPSKVTRQSLELLAETILCHNHMKQMYEKIAIWNLRIANYLDEFHERPSAAAVPERDQRQTESDVLKTEIETVRKEMEKVRTERDESQSNSTEQKAEIEKLRLQQDQSLQRYERAERRLKGKIRESESMIDNLKEGERSKLAEITSLNKQLTEFKTSATANSDEIQRLSKEVANKDVASKEFQSTQLSKLAELKENFNDRDAQIQKLETTLQNTITDHNTQLQNLETTLTDRDAQIQKLETANQTLRDSRNENKRRISKLEQQNQKLKRQKHLAAFRHAVQLLIEKRKYERVEAEKRTLEGHTVVLRGRLEETQEQVKGREVSATVS